MVGTNGKNGGKVKDIPSPNGDNGRDPKTGQFIKGWKGGPGNPLAGKMSENRAHLIQSIQPGDIEDCLETLLDILRDTEQPAAARIQAADKLITYACGKPKEYVEHSGTITLADLYNALGATLRAG